MRLQRRVLGYLAAAAIASCVLTVGVGVVLVRHQIAKQRLSTLEAQADLVAAVGGVPGRAHARRSRLSGRQRPPAAARSPGAGCGAGRAPVRGRRPGHGRRRRQVADLRGAAHADRRDRADPPGERSFLRVAAVHGEPPAGRTRRRATRRGAVVPARPSPHPPDRRAVGGDPPAGARARPGSRCRSTERTSSPTSARPSTRCRTSCPRAREAQGRFLESVSHELRTPLDVDPRLCGGARGGGDPAGRVGAGDRGRGRSARAARRRPARPRAVRPFRASRSPASPSIWPASSSRRSSVISRALGTCGVELSGAGDARRLGARRPRPDPPGRLEPDRERAAGDAVGRVGGGQRRGRRNHRPRHRPGPRPRGHPAGVRALLPVRAVSQRAAGRLRARPRDRPGARRRRWAAASRRRRAAGGGAAVHDPAAVYTGALRSARCCPTFRLTRWSALSTVLQSHPIRRPTSS